MNKVALIGGGAGLAYLGYKLYSESTQAKDLDKKFKVYNGLPQNIKLAGGDISLSTPVNITNQSTYDVPVENLFINISYKDIDNVWQDLFYQPSSVVPFVIKKGATTRLPFIGLKMPLTNALVVLKILSGNLSSQLKISSRLQIKGIELKPIETIVDAKSYLQPLISLLQKTGLGGTGTPELSLGYAKQSFHYRQIKPAPAQVIAMMPKGKRIEKVIRNNGGSAYNTIDEMAKIVAETLYQTKDLAAYLKGSTKEHSVKNVYRFMHDHFQYKQDDKTREQLREPVASFADRASGIDCDCFSIFVSSLLTNMQIDHAIEMCMIAPNHAFVHVYVVVPKTGTAITQRQNYWVVDPCLHFFDQIAPKITLKYDKQMLTTRLSGLGSGMGCLCPPSTNGTFGASAKRPNLHAIEMHAIEPLRQMLLRTKATAKNSPASIGVLYNSGALVKGIDYVLAHWNNPQARAKALETLSAQDDKITNKLVINTLMGAGAFEGLGGVNYNPTEQYPLFGIDDTADQLTIEGLGGLFQSIKKGVQSVNKFVKANSTKGLDKLKQAATFVKNNIQKVNPGMIGIRTAYRGLLAINLRGQATNLAKIISTPAGQAKVRALWTGPFIGGNWGELVASINAGKNKKPLFGNGVNGLGIVVATGTAAAVASATPIIAKMASLISSLISKVAPAVKVFQKGKQLVNKGQHIIGAGKNLLPTHKKTASQNGGDGKQQPATPELDMPAVSNAIAVRTQSDDNTPANTTENAQSTESSSAPKSSSTALLISLGIAGVVGVIALSSGGSTSKAPAKSLDGLKPKTKAKTKAKVKTKTVPAFSI